MKIFTQTAYEHIVLDERGIPYLAGTRIKVAHLAAEHTNYGWDGKELADQHPPLTLGQVYSALAYYWDHKEAVDGYNQDTFDYAEAMRKTLPAFPRLAELRAQYETE